MDVWKIILLYLGTISHGYAICHRTAPIGFSGDAQSVYYHKNGACSQQQPHISTILIMASIVIISNRVLRNEKYAKDYLHKSFRRPTSFPASSIISESISRCLFVALVP